MSVINDMLNALDARRAPPLAGTTAISVEHSTPGSRRWRVMVVLGTAAVAATAFADWPVLLSSAPRAPQPPAIVAGALAPTVANLAAQADASAPPADPLAPPVATAPAAARRVLQASVAPRAVAQGAPMAPTPFAQTAALTPAATTAPVALPAPVALAAPNLRGTAEKHPVAPSAGQRATLAYRQALDLGASGHSSAAIDRALEALAADPDHAGARQLAAVLMFEARRLDEAGALLRAGLDRMPQQPRLAYLLARLKAETGDADGALALLPASTALAGEAHGLRAAILARQGRYTEALPAYEAALRQDPGNATWWLGLGLALEANQQFDLARQALRRARALGTLQPDVQTYIEHKLASLG